MERSQEIEAVVRRLFESIGSTDLSGFDAILSREPGLVFLGTDPAEWWEGYETVSPVAEAQLKDMQGIRVEVADVAGYSEAGVGWSAARVRYTMPDGSSNDVRFTGVFHREGGEWTLVQGHSSIGVLNKEAFGVTMPT